MYMNDLQQDPLKQPQKIMIKLYNVSPNDYLIPSRLKQSQAIQECSILIRVAAAWVTPVPVSEGSGSHYRVTMWITAPSSGESLDHKSQTMRLLRRS
ncbi:hypothetical protein CEXT_235441 [Caerostris extrusa]|uniref:Uncharacterized protein n=1 Tax=Caerostris extrusa TaxID=172846 RepID=A0AAV4SI69_CAEEX|nr:hypothetical protein CEXT_235441 [Caerostris extrusa]